MNVIDGDNSSMDISNGDKSFMDIINVDNSSMDIINGDKPFIDSDDIDYIDNINQFFSHGIGK